MRPTSRILPAALGCLLAAGAAQADEPIEGGDHLVGQLERAQLVFRGVVSAVEYRNSEPGKEQPGIPHTFVTFQIEQLYKPRPDPERPGRDPIFSMESITLRFIGGLDRDPDRVMLMSEAPLFDVGDRDFLLVGGNGRDACPLVDCEGGRFRAVDALMYDDDGRSIELARDAMTFGPRVSLFDIDNDRVGPHLLTRVVDDPPDEEGTPAPRASNGVHMTEAVFADFLEQTLQTRLTPAQLTRIPRLVTTDPAFPFEVDYARHVAPMPRRDDRAPALPSSLRDPSEQLEFERYQRNGGDPRL